MNAFSVVRGARRRLLWLRLVGLSLVVGWLLAPADVRDQIPASFPFLLALTIEGQFFAGAVLGARRDREREATFEDDELLAERRSPQLVDVAELGWDEDAEQARMRLEAAPRRRQPLVELAVVAAVCLLAFVVVNYERQLHGWSAISPAQRTLVTQRLSAQATQIAGHPARVICDTSRRRVGAVQEADGLAEVGGGRTWLTPEICATLAGIVLHHDSDPFERDGRALVVLAHESWHLHGVSLEGVANCFAYQSGAEIGVRLGLSHGDAEQMMRSQLAQAPALYAGAPAYQTPSGCHDGGPLDLHPHSSLWP